MIRQYIAVGVIYSKLGRVKKPHQLIGVRLLPVMQR